MEILLSVRSETGEQWDHGGPSPVDRASPVLDASTTVNPFPSKELLVLLTESLEKARNYPDPWSSNCREAISLRYSISLDRILPGPGATLLLYHLIRGRFFKRVILPEPIFSEYARGASAANIPVIRIPPSIDLLLGAHRRIRWGISLDRLASCVGPGDLVVLVNPVNPTGQEFSLESLLALSQSLREKGGWLLIDESFQDFIDNRSSLLFSQDKEVLILRSMTKISGLPGIRAGFLVASDQMVSPLRMTLGPWSVGSLEQTLLQWSMDRRGAKEFGWDQTWKEDLRSILEEIGLDCVHGEGPMILAAPGWSPEQGVSARRLFAEQGVRIRLAEGFGPTDGAKYLRIGYEAFSRSGEFIHFLEKFCDR